MGIWDLGLLGCRERGTGGARCRPLTAPCRCAGSWGILFSHPRDFTPVCTTELGRAAKLAAEFSKRNVKMIALSIDSVPDHLAWSKVWGHRGDQGHRGDRGVAG